MSINHVYDFSIFERQPNSEVSYKGRRNNVVIVQVEKILPLGLNVKNVPKQQSRKRNRRAWPYNKQLVLWIISINQLKQLLRATFL
jgi:rRNA maturation protein Rpf1